MSDYKEKCPGCESHTSAVMTARVNGDPCPSCGLSAKAATEIHAVRQRGANEEIKAEFVQLRLRAARAERDKEALEECVAAIREAMRELERHEEREAQREWNER